MQWFLADLENDALLLFSYGLPTEPLYVDQPSLRLLAAPCTQCLTSLLIVEAASAESVSKGSGLMAGTPDSSAFVCLDLYTGFEHIQWTLAYPVLGYTALRLSERRTGFQLMSISVHGFHVCVLAVRKERRLHFKSSCSRWPKSRGEPK